MNVCAEGGEERCEEISTWFYDYIDGLTCGTNDRMAESTKWTCLLTRTVSVTRDAVTEFPKIPVKDLEVGRVK